MKKIGIAMLWDGENYGNRLQIYAVQETLRPCIKTCLRHWMDCTCGPGQIGARCSTI
jgi:hypothetical protein